MLMLLSARTLTTEQLDNLSDFLIGHNSPSILISHAVPVVHLKSGMPQKEHKTDWPHNSSICSNILLFVLLFVCLFVIVAILTVLSTDAIRDILQHLRCCWQDLWILSNLGSFLQGLQSHF